MTDTAHPKGRPAFLLPWRLVALLFAAMCLAGGGAFATVGASYVPGAVAGLILGFFGTVFGGRIKTAWAVGCVAAATWATGILPAWISFYALAPAFAILAGIELDRFGTRVTIFAIMAWITLDSPVTATTAALPLVLVFVAVAGFGIGMALLVHAENRVAPVAVERGYAIAHGSALAVGLVLAHVIASQFAQANSHWIALLFAARALDPPGSHIAKATTRGLAMVLGAGLASALVLLPMTVTVFGVLAIGFLLIGLRYLPSGGWISPAMMSAGIVLASSPTMNTAIFRAEAAVVASGLVVLVFFLARLIRQRAFSGPNV